MRKNTDKTHAFLERVLHQGNTFYWVGSLMSAFSFTGQVLEEDVVWDIIAKNSGDTPLDNGMPKVRGEVLVLGKAYLRDKSEGNKNYIQIKISNIDKKLTSSRLSDESFGPLQWDKLISQNRGGTYNAQYIQKYWPAYPPDLDWSLFNIAPVDQQIKGFWSGSESGCIWNMHPEKDILPFQLPGLRCRCVIVTEQDSTKLIELQPNLDTIMLFPESEIGILIYRVLYKLRTDNYEEEIKDVYSFWEDMNAPPRAVLESDFINDKNPERSSLSDEDVDESNTFFREMHFSGGHEEQAEHIQPSEQEIKDIISGTKIFSGYDLSSFDFSGCDLRNADFSDAILDGVKFIKADLTGANFSSSSCINADFKDAVLDDCDFSDSDMSGACLAGTSLNYAIFQRANLKDIDLTQVKAKMACFIEADLSGAKCTEADFTASDFSSAILDNADFSKAILKGCTLEGSKAVKVNLNTSDLSEITCDGKTLFQETVFINTNLTEVCFEQSILEKCTFKHVIMDMSVFSGSRLNECNFFSSSAKQVRFDNVEFHNVNIAGTNLMQSDFYMALFNHTDIYDSNLFECNLFKIKKINTKFINCNLKRTLYEVYR